MNVLRALRVHTETFLVLSSILIALSLWRSWPRSASAGVDVAISETSDTGGPPRQLEVEASSTSPGATDPRTRVTTLRPDVRQREQILLLGDSMVEVLLPRLADYALENGDELVPAIWYGSTTGAWARTPELTALIRDVKPTLVVIALGSSELSLRDVEARRPVIEALVRRIGASKLVWIGPPNWRPDTGINDLLASVVGDDRFFRSSTLELTRKRDGIHPDRAGGRLWAGAFVDWLGRSRYELVMRAPTLEAAPVPARVLGRM